MEKIIDVLNEYFSEKENQILDLDDIHKEEQELQTLVYDLYNNLFGLYFKLNIITEKRLALLNEIYQASESIGELSK